jgi:hypothetical protein
MKAYPSIPALIQMGLPIYAFDKIKSEAWYAELHEHCAGDEKLYEVLK